jgi:glucose/arabinose dehydrogenase
MRNQLARPDRPATAARTAAWVTGALALGACAGDVAAPRRAPDAGPAPARAAAATSVPCAPNNGDITLPAGFCAAVVADRIGSARHLAVSQTGDLYVAIDGTTGPGGVLALRDADGDGRAEVQEYFGAVRANGIIIARNALYVAYRDQIVRYRLVPGQLVPRGEPEVIVSGLPFSGDHGRKNIQSDGRGALYVNIGSASNACQVANRQLRSPGVDPCPELDVRAAIWRFDLMRAGQTLESGTRFAAGYRNTEALHYDRTRRALFGIPHGRDMLADNWPELFTDQQAADLPSEEFVRIDRGSDNGWPYCYHDWQRGAKPLAPEYGGDGSVVGPRCATKNRPLLAFPGHWAPNDLLFYYGRQFPARYRGGAFVAFHGGFDRAPLPNEGYNVAFVPFGPASPSGPSETFADGFTGGGTPLPANAAYRPMGLAEGPDGSLYLSSDRNGRIWRIMYRGE